MNTNDPLAKFFDRDQFAKHAGIELVEVSPGRATARMRLEPKHWNGVNIAHGGALFTLADFAFAAASNSHGTVAVAINAHITFMKAASDGVLTAEAREISKNFKLGSYTIEIRDEQGDLVALFQGMVYRKSDKLPLEATAA
jgi:acyl-CoA thioesterase